MMAVAKSGKPDSGRARKSRGRGLRTTTGCITCRKRHLKCDETRPICQSCARNKKSCIYPDSGPELASHVLQPSSDGHNSTPSAASHANAEEPPNALVNDQNQTSPPQFEQYNLTFQSQDTIVNPAPQDDHIGADNQEQPANLLNDSARELSRAQTLHIGTDGQLRANTLNYTSPVSVGTGSASDQPIGVATARWFGMLAGDADIPLDLSLDPSTSLPDSHHNPSSEHHAADSRPTQDGETDYVDAPLSGNTVINPTIRQCSAEEYSWQSDVFLTLKPDEETMFQTFVMHISKWIDLFDPYQHFSALVPRLALHNTGLLNAILALSLRHNSLGSHPLFAREDALQYYHETLQYVREAMQHTSYHTSLELLATTLIISAYEMLDGSSRDWERHLQGVFWIQRSQVIHGDSGGLRGAIWWAWLCQDTWAAFRDKRKVFTFWKPQRTLAELSPWDLAARSIYILGRVMNYCAQSESDDLPDNIVSRIRSAKALSATLDEWASLLTAEFLPLPHTSTLLSSFFQPLWIHPPVYAVAIQVHHASRILVLLHQPSLGGISEGMKRQSTLEGHVETICGIALVLSDYASSIMTSQCLFIAGLCTHDRQRRDEIIELLVRCRSRTGWPRVPLEDELRVYWQRPTKSSWISP